MIEKLKEIEEKYIQMEAKLSRPEVVADLELYKKLMKEYKNLSPLVEKYREYTGAEQTLHEAEEIMAEEDDPDMKQMAQEEYRNAKEKIKTLLDELQILLLPRDPNDDKNVIIEIRAGAGGEEAALFAGDLYRMYTMYAASVGWKTSLIDCNETELGGFREVSFIVEGDGAYSKLKFESGVHRVQRVPETESQGRLQTSTVTVAVLPEMDDDVDIQIRPEDLSIETCKSSGAGGQHINKTESAIRILHKPSGIVVFCQTERSQLQNKETAMKMLRTKLYDIETERRDAELASTRKSQVGTGDRSERIRTYNYPESRVSDHRIKLTLYNLGDFMNGDISQMIDALIAADTAEKLKAGNE